jgi:hypothetical protein
MRAALENSVLQHPWVYAAIVAGAGAVIWMVVLSVPAGAVFGLVGFAGAGWSVSRGPGRRSLERRIVRRHPN